MLRQIDVEDLAHQILQAVSIGVGAGQPRGDLGAVHRLRHHAEGIVQRRKIEPREVEDFRDLRIAQQRLQIRRVGVIFRDLHHIGAAVAVRQLHHAEPVAVRMQPHGLGIDRHRIGIAGQIGQVAAMQADGHDAVKPRRIGAARTNVEIANEGSDRRRQAPVSISNY